MQLAAEIVSWVLIMTGSFFYLTGAIGLLRMPDVFARMHAASVSDTVGASLLLTGMMVQAGLTLVTAKLVILLALLLLIGPAATHALARAARYAGVEPVLAGDGANSPAPAIEKSREAVAAKPKKLRGKKQAVRRKPFKKKGRR